MNRRELMLLLGAAMAAGRDLRAQQKAMPVIGYLGAASLGDIGRHFPDTDQRWKDSSSIDLLRQAVAMVHTAGFRVVNLDVVVILEKPKIAPHLDAIRAQLAGALEIAVERVSVKGKTNEGVDAVGRGEAIAAHAVALLAVHHPVQPE